MSKILHTNEVYLATFIKNDAVVTHLVKAKNTQFVEVIVNGEILPLYKCNIKEMQS